MTPNTRKPDESFEDYKQRCKDQTKIERLLKQRPKILYDSSRMRSPFVKSAEAK